MKTSCIQSRSNEILFHIMCNWTVEDITTGSTEVKNCAGFKEGLDGYMDHRNIQSEQLC